jgi:Kef-type K+ transport system membrane component KefB
VAEENVARGWNRRLLQVLQDRGEANSRHGRATFSVLLLQDLAVVLVFMLVPLLAPTPDGTIHTLAILIALAQAVLKTAAAITCIMLLGRVMLRPLYRAIASTQNAEIFAATTLLTCLGTSLLTESLGLSAALGAFLAGLLLAETEFHLQVRPNTPAHAQSLQTARITVRV